MKHGSLFSGLGGFDLAATWMNWDNVFICENDPFCREILTYYWPHTTSYGDIRKFYATKYRGLIDVLSAGFPCQPFSLAGKRKGNTDDRFLWPETLRIINEIRPHWIVLENVPGLLSILEQECLSEVEFQETELFHTDEKIRSGKTVLSVHRRIIATIIQQIGNAGYYLPRLSDGTPVILCVPACSVGAPHQRDRIWIVASQKQYELQSGYPEFRFRQDNKYGSNKEFGTAAYADCECMERWPEAGNTETKGKKPDQFASGLFQFNDWENWPSQFPLYRRNDGFSKGLDGITFPKLRKESLKAFGNAIVPQEAFVIYRTINIVSDCKMAASDC